MSSSIFPRSLMVVVLLSSVLASGCSDSSPSNDQLPGETDAGATTDGEIGDPVTSEDNTDSPEPENTDPSEDQLPSLQELYPTRSTIFGEDINTIPGPSIVVPNSDTLIWEYSLQDNQLINSSFEPLLSHRLAWERFVELTPGQYLKSIYEVFFEAREFGFFGSTFWVTAYLSKEPGEQETRIKIGEPFPREFFIAHSNGFAPDYSYNTGVFIHEIGHLIANEHQIENDYLSTTYSLGPWHTKLDSPLRTYLEQFWEGDVYQYWSDNNYASNLSTLVQDRFPDQFVSTYAATNFTEDFAESFLTFVEEDSQPLANQYPGSDKVIWFWNQPEYVLARDQIRAKIDETNSQTGAGEPEN